MISGRKKTRRSGFFTDIYLKKIKNKIEPLKYQSVNLITSYKTPVVTS